MPQTFSSTTDRKHVEEDAFSSDKTNRLPELGELDADDIIAEADAAEGATEIMTRDDPAFAKKMAALMTSSSSSSIPTEEKDPSSLDALALTIPAKGKTKAMPALPSGKKAPPLPPMKSSSAPPPPPGFGSTLTSSPPPPPARPASIKPPPPAPRVEAIIPKAANTAPIVDLDSDDLEDDEQMRTKVMDQPKAPAAAVATAVAERMERTQPFDRSRIFGAPRPNETKPNFSGTQPSAAWRAAPVPRDLDLAPRSAITTPRPSTTITAALPSVVITEPTHARPASIAPIAIDVPVPSQRPDATQKLPALRVVSSVPPPQRAANQNQTHTLAAAIAGGVALCAAAIIAIVAGTASTADSSTKNTPTVAAPKPREAQQNSARSAVIETPETTPAKAEAPLAARDEDGIPLSSPGALPSAPSPKGGAVPSEQTSTPAPVAATTPVHHAHTSSVKAPAAAEPAPTAAAAPVAAAPVHAAAPARPSGPASTTGTIEVPPTLMTVMVDGDYRRVSGGRIVVSCGKHRVNAGRGTKDVDVPCGGVASVM